MQVSSRFECNATARKLLPRVRLLGGWRELYRCFGVRVEEQQTTWQVETAVCVVYCMSMHNYTSNG